MQQRPDEPRLRMLSWGFVAVAMVLLVVLSQTVERTPDERNYQLAGRALLQREGLHAVEQRFQGPLILLGTQLTDDREASIHGDETLRRARLGMLVFPLLLLVVVRQWSRRAFGDRTAAVATFLMASNPVLLGYGPLLSSDVAYTAATLLAGWLAWRWLQAPGPMTLACFGLGLGAALATKYTAALTVPALAFAVLLAALGGFDAWPAKDGTARGPARRVGGAALALLAAALVAVGFLYAAYLFASPPLGSDGVAALTSPLMQAVKGVPLASTLLAALPEPMVLGVDYQAVWASAKSHGTFLDGRGNHWAFFPVTVLFKTPVAVLVFALVGAAAATRDRARWPLWSVALIPPFALLAYCSATRALQMGIRYVMPVVPALVLLAAAGLSQPWLRGRLAAVVLALVAAASAYDVASSWPHHIGYFNQLAGGPAGGCLVVPDGNCEWGQRQWTRSPRLAGDHPDLEFLRPRQGPRFGQVAAYVYDLKAVDPRDTGRVYHWLRRFEPFDHDGAAWFAYDVSPEDFERAILAGDARAAEDLAVAWVRRRDFDAARAALAAVPEPARTDGTTRMRRLVDAAAAAGDEGAARDRVALQFEAVGYPELGLSLIDRDARANALTVARMMAATGRPLEAIDWLEERTADGSRTFAEVYLMATGLFDGGPGYGPKPVRALALMEQGPAPAPGSPGYAPWTELKARVQDAIARERRLGTIK